MKNYTFHWELRTILAQFEDAFNDIVIKRYNISKEPQDQIHVNFRLSPKTRVLHDIVNQNKNIKLPCVAVMPGGFKRDSNRVFNNIAGSFYTDTVSMTAWQQLYQPVPISLTVNMSIIARNLIDADQIITNFVPYCDPYIIVSWKWPISIGWADFEIRSKIIWNENVSFQYPNDLGNNTSYRVIADTSFTIESWMFKNNPEKVGPIYVIKKAFNNVLDFKKYSVMKSEETIDNTDYFDISARPQFYVCKPFKFYVEEERSLNCIGDMFDYVDDVYLSADNVNMFEDVQWYSPFNGISAYIPLEESYLWPSVSSYFTYSSLEGLPSSVVTEITSITSYYINDLNGYVFQDKELRYPGFSAYHVCSSDWDLINKNIMTINVCALTSGTFDVIAVNEAAYGKMMEDTVRDFPNPYPIGSDKYNTYKPIQPDCVSGIKVF